jgi:hypothetical protein
MNGTTKNFTAAVTLVTAVMALCAAGVWGAFMFGPGPFSGSLRGIDWVPLIVCLAMGVGLFRKTVKLSARWPKEIYWSLTSLFVVMVLFLIWAATPLSSCGYFPMRPANCDMVGGALLEAP